MRSNASSVSNLTCFCLSTCCYPSKCCFLCEILRIVRCLLFENSQHGVFFYLSHAISYSHETFLTHLRPYYYFVAYRFIGGTIWSPLLAKHNVIIKRITHDYLGYVRRYAYTCYVCFLIMFNKCYAKNESAKPAVLFCTKHSYIHICSLSTIYGNIL